MIHVLRRVAGALLLLAAVCPGSLRAITVTGHGVPICNGTDTTIGATVCNAESVTVSATSTTSASGGLPGVAGISTGVSATVSTGLSASSCASTSLKPGACACFEYTFECELEVNWFTGDVTLEGCELVKIELKTVRND